jgi:hypothetical protein
MYTDMADDVRRAARRAAEIVGMLDAQHVWLCDVASAVNIPMSLFAPMIMQLHRFGLVTLSAVLPEPSESQPDSVILDKQGRSAILYGNIGVFHAIEI